jgi:hypothetical protein
MIPYIGDAAKLGKLGKWSKTIDRAIDVARKAPNAAMTKALRRCQASRCRLKPKNPHLVQK